MVDVSYHPKFNFKSADQMAHKSLTSSMPALPLQEHNLALLTLGGPPAELSASMINAINERLSSPPPPRDKGLSGSLAEIDLPLVVQTITNARKEGALILSDERNRPLARLFCRDGKILHAIYGPLTNETAIYQIIGQHISGNFHFNSKKEPDWAAGVPIARPTDMLLIESYRRLDEIPKMLLELGSETTIFQRTAEKPPVEALPAEVRADVTALWPYLDGQVPIGKLWRYSRLDDYAIFQALVELSKAHVLKEVDSCAAVKMRQPRPLVMAPEMPLAPFDEIENLTVDSLVGRPSVHAGHLLGSLRPGDPWHLLHNLDLPAEAAGSPIFKEGQVIGVHCGVLPASPQATSGASRLNQLLWVESVVECLDNQQRRAAARRVGHHPATAGWDARKWHASTAPVAAPPAWIRPNSANYAAQPLIQDLEPEAPGFDKRILLGALAAVVVLLLAATGYWVSKSWHVPAAAPVTRAAAKAWLTPTLLLADKKTAQWVPVPASTTFRNGELISLKMKLSEESFVYVLHQGANPTDIDLLFPGIRRRRHKIPERLCSDRPARDYDQSTRWISGAERPDNHRFPRHREPGFPGGRQTDQPLYLPGNSVQGVRNGNQSAG